jgi:hypothetical protein
MSLSVPSTAALGNVTIAVTPHKPKPQPAAKPARTF